MLEDLRKQFLDEMSHKERSIFLYHCLLKLSGNEIARRLKLPNKYVRLITKNIDSNIGFMEIKEDLLDAYVQENENQYPIVEQRSGRNKK